jgi:alkylation response protein AidB-like acyl-CoA dehydrogenase
MLHSLHSRHLLDLLRGGRSGAFSRSMGALAQLNVADPLHLDAQLTDEERMIRDSARAFASSALAPRVKAAYRAENFDRAIMKEMGDAGLLGATVKVRRAAWVLCSLSLSLSVSLSLRAARAGRVRGRVAP